jgi:ribosomal protein S18 acetylase RimI-like enzyme
MKIQMNEKLDANELNDLLETNKWRIQDPEKLEKALNLSWCWLTARNEKSQLVGFVQVLSDGIRHAYILRLIVHPEYQRQGIGTELMNKLMEILKENNLLPTLVATPGKDKFYEKFGFKQEYKNMKAMCIR